MPCKKGSKKTSSKGKRTSGRKASKKATVEPTVKPIEVDPDTKTILKAFLDLGSPARIKEVAEKAKMSTQKVAGKVRFLVRKGLIKKVSAGVYELTELGTATASA